MHLFGLKCPVMVGGGCLMVMGRQEANIGLVGGAVDSRVALNDLQSSKARFGLMIDL